MRLALAMFSVCFLSGVAHAEPEANKFLRDYDTGTEVTKHLMLDGLSQIELGMSWANVFIAEDRKERPLYCPPNTLVLTGEQLVDVLRREMEKSPDEGSRPVGFVLLFALQKEFACQPHSN